MAFWISAIAAIAPLSLPAVAASRGEYETCAANLLAKGIAPEDAANACGEALRPEDLSRCVVQISQPNSVAAADALSACRQVRRPLDLATCVVNINRDTKAPPALEVLDNCRRSLLPVDFASCVVGLSRKINLASSQLMATCIDTSERPRDIAPNFIPSQPAPQPTLTPLTPMIPQPK